MCRYFSAIKTEEKLLWLMDSMSHEDIIREFKLNDKTDNPKFVRLEFTPKDDNIFNHDLENWELHVDQDLTPEWWDKDMKKVAIVELKEEIQKHWKQRFILEGMSVDEIKEGMWYMNGGTLNAMRGGTLDDMRGGTLNYMWGGTLNAMRGGTLNAMRGGTLNAMRGGTLDDMWGGTLNDMCGGTLNAMRGGTLNAMWGGTLNAMWGGTLNAMRGGTLNAMNGGTLDDMWGGTLLSYNGTLPTKITDEYGPKIILPNDKKVIVPVEGWKIQVGLK